MMRSCKGVKRRAAHKDYRRGEDGRFAYDKENYRWWK